MQKVDKIISANWVLPIAPVNTVLEYYSVVIHHERILALLPTSEVTSLYHTDEHIQLKNHILLPGLINAHTHSPMILFRGLADDLPLMDWLNHHIWPAENDILNSHSIRDGMFLAIAEMLRGGTTCFNEMYFFPNETAQVVAETGLRGLIGHMIMNVPTKWAQNAKEYVQKAREAHQNRVCNPRLHFNITPHATYTNDDHNLILAKELAEEFGLRMNIHLHETQAELDMELKNHGMRPIARLEKLGLIDHKLTAIHMVHLNDDEIDLIKERGTQVVHCPESNLKLASGFSPVVKMLRKGVNVALGTDGPASNNDLDLFTELRTASFLAKALNQDATALPAAQALELVTYRAAKAIGLEQEIGSLEPGKAADMIAVDISSHLAQPIYNPMSHLVYAANRLQVSDVWVAGKQLLKQGQFTQLDIERILANALPWAKKTAKYSNYSAAMPGEI